MKIIDEFFLAVFLLFLMSGHSWCIDQDIWECYAVVMKLKFKNFKEINFEKTEIFYVDFTKTFGEINLEKIEKFYRNLTKTLFSIILHAKEPQHKILMSWSMKFKRRKEKFNFEERNLSNNSYLVLSWSIFQVMFFIHIRGSVKSKFRYFVSQAVGNTACCNDMEGNL